MRKSRLRRNVLWLLLVTPLGLNGCQKEDEPEGVNETENSTEGPCPWDDNDEVARAAVLGEATPVEGFICPNDDQDWYSFSVPDGMSLVTVALTIADFGSITPTYTIWTGAQEEVAVSPESSESAKDQVPLTITYGLQPGDYTIVVKDQGDGMDVWHPYSLTVTSGKDKDANEPNDSAGQAAAGSGTVEGYISYRGDEDWYRVQSNSTGLLTVDFQMPAAGIVPTYRIEDASGNVIIERSNMAGMSEDTAMHFVESLGAAGDYYLIVSDVDKLKSDSAVAYTLTLAVSADPDANEGNDEPADATDLTGGAPLPLGDDWVERSASGYVASIGDVDWYRVDFEGGNRGVVEAEVHFSSRMPEDMQASVRFMYGVPGEPCSADAECETLSTTCMEDIDCAMLGSSCDNSGYCAGAGRCIDGNCGAVLTSLTAIDTDPRNVILSAPLIDISTVYVVVSDYHDDAYTASNEYDLTVRVALEPDPREPSDAYSGVPPTQEWDETWQHQEYAIEIPVHDCPVAGGADCCDGGAAWESGVISYTFDQDWYSYAHPCPEADCMMAVHLDLGGGRVDFLPITTRDGTPWVEFTTPSDTGGNNPEINNVYGGLTGSDECFFAHNMHGEYNFVVRDTTWISEENPNGGTWDADKNQPYRFCIEKIADGCSVPPCTTDDYGCFIPDE